MTGLKKILAAWMIIAGFSATAAAESYSFACISSGSAANCATGSTQLRVDVLNFGANQTLFQFYNIGASSSSITDIYFDDGTLLGIAQVNNSSGVSFSPPATPGNLPDGNNADPDFVTTAGFSADSDPPVSPNGVNPGETLGILFNLQPGKSFSSVINALTLAGAPGGLRIGLHVQSFSNGGSGSFINAVSPVPEINQWLMMLLGFTFIAIRNVASARSEQNLASKLQS